ncbi:MULTISPECIES: DUF1688 family protein [Pannonibacter]|uniref:DUF1688 family protein n=1 Tax=Pannonibacter TaxID=227873 RepID=UPI000F01D1F6|nr:DUF1688 family protein [Pannonibacter phragmitetus]
MTTPAATETPSEAISLLTAQALREGAARLLDLARQTALAGIRVDEGKLEPLAQQVASILRAAAPEAGLAPHSLWRLAEAGGEDRWGMIAGARAFPDVRMMGRAAFDAAITAVLMTPPADPDWRFEDPFTGESLAGAEGMTAATLSAFASGLFSAVPADPIRADAHALIRVETEELARALQVDEDHAATLAARLHRLGELAGMRPDLFARDDEPRPGGLFDVLFDEGQEDGSLSLARIFALVMEGLVPLWEGPESLNGVPLGDTVRVPALEGRMAGEPLLPLHERARFLALSLVEPLAWAGIAPLDLDGPGGPTDADHVQLMLAGGVLSFSLQDGEAQVQAAMLRGLAGALTLELANKVRDILETGAEELPLTCIEEAGTLPLAAMLLRENPAAVEDFGKIAAAGTVF